MSEIPASKRSSIKKSNRAFRFTAIGGNFSSVFFTAEEVYPFVGGRAHASFVVPEYCRVQVVERSAIVTFTARQMFELVNDVGRYPEFLPWCASSSVAELSESERLASVRVVRGVLRTEFTTRNVLIRDAQILMHLVDGPFKNLSGQWRFDAIGETGSRVHFRVEFEFKNRLTAAALSSVFESLCGSIVDAFAQRARKIYD